MNTRKILFILLSLYTINCYSQTGTQFFTEKNDLEYLGYKGKVKQVKISVAISNDSTINVKSNENDAFISFNNYGYIIEFKNSSSRVGARYKYEINNDKITKVSKFQDKITDSLILIYNTKDELIKAIEYNNTYNELYIYLYNNDTLVRSTYLLKDSSLWAIDSTFFNDARLRIKSIERCIVNGNLLFKGYVKYNKQNKEIERFSYKNDSTIDAICFSKYNSKGNIKKFIGPNFYTTYKYDKHQNIVQENYYSDGKLGRQFYYIYDNQGNWIKRIIKIGEQYSITIRKIEYYK